MIHTYIPYAPEEQGNNLGWAYNNFMELIPDNDWACFLDHDATFTTRYWYYQLEKIIKDNPSFGLFTSMTNRIRPGSYQLFPDIPQDIHDIKYHRKVGNLIKEKYNTSIQDITQPPRHDLSGVVILLSKDTWKNVGGFIDGFLGVDNNIHKKCRDSKIKVGLMLGVYVYHWYRGDGDVSHLKNK